MNLVISALLFFPEKDFYALPQDFGLSPEEVFVTTQDNCRLHGWFFKANPAKAALLFLHGNAGNISGRLSKAKGWVNRGVSVLLVDYRGYGRSGGKIEKGLDLVEDAHSALRWLEEGERVPAEKIILYGESIGSYPATQLAAEKKFAGLILEAPFTTLPELARRHYGWMPAAIFLKDFQMRNQDVIRYVKAPVFILHGERDEICPREMGERLYELAPSPKEIYVVPRGTHNDLPETAGESYFEYPHRFLFPEDGFGERRKQG